jgi:hypothetical protein
LRPRCRLSGWVRQLAHPGAGCHTVGLPAGALPAVAQGAEAAPRAFQSHAAPLPACLDDCHHLHMPCLGAHFPKPRTCHFTAVHCVQKLDAVVFVQGNCFPPSNRTNLVAALMAHLRVDSLGYCLRNTQVGVGAGGGGGGGGSVVVVAVP